MLQPADAQWLADAFGIGGPAHLSGPVDRGAEGQVWRLSVGPDVFAVKEGFAALSEERIHRAWAFQRRTTQEFGVIAPGQLSTTGGQLSAACRGELVRLFTWTELAPPTRDLDAAAVGATLARLHRAGGPSPDAIEEWYWKPLGRAHWTGLVEQATRSVAPFAAALGGMVDDLVATEAVLRLPTAALCLAHRDLWADNLRSTRSGSLIVLDWDSCGPASLDEELAMVLVEYGTSAARVRELYGAYRAAGGPGQVVSVSDFTMPLAFLGRLLALAVRDWLAADTDAERSRNEVRVREFVDDPIGLATVGSLLDSLP